MLAGGHSPRSEGAAWRIPLAQPRNAASRHGRMAPLRRSNGRLHTAALRRTLSPSPPRSSSAPPLPLPAGANAPSCGRRAWSARRSPPACCRTAASLRPREGRLRRGGALPCSSARRGAGGGARQQASADERGVSGEKRRRAPCATSEALPALYCVTLKTWWFLHFGALQKVRSVFGAFTCGGERGGAAGGGAAAGGGGAAAANVAQARASGGPRGRADHAAAARLYTRATGSTSE